MAESASCLFCLFYKVISLWIFSLFSAVIRFCVPQKKDNNSFWYFQTVAQTYCTQVRRVLHTLDSGQKFSLKLTPKQWKRCTVHQVKHFKRFFTITSNCNSTYLTHSVLLRSNKKLFLFLLIWSRNWRRVKNHRGVWLVESWSFIIWASYWHGKQFFLFLV